MYAAHDLYEQDVQDLGDTALWRYMSLDELLGLLSYERLWLSCIAAMEDQQEGLYFWDSTHDSQMAKIAERRRLDYFISCWSALPDESLALWKSYTDERGVVVKSDVKSIVRSLGSQDDDNVFLGRIKYVERPPDLHSFRDRGTALTDALFFKSSAFSYENEIRLVSSGLLGKEGISVANLNSRPAQRVSGVRVELRQLIHEIRVSPFSEPWFRDVVDSTMARVGASNTPVRYSGLRASFVKSSHLAVPEFSHGPPAQSATTHMSGLYEKTDDGYRRIC